MVIEVGKKYRTKAGDVATIERVDGYGGGWPYKGRVVFTNFSREFGWDQYGKCSTVPTSLDLVESVGLTDCEKVQKLKNLLCDGYKDASTKLERAGDLLESFDDDECC